MATCTNLDELSSVYAHSYLTSLWVGFLPCVFLSLYFGFRIIMFCYDV